MCTRIRGKGKERTARVFIGLISLLIGINLLSQQWREKKLHNHKFKWRCRTSMKYSLFGGKHIYCELFYKFTHGNEIQLEKCSLYFQQA